MEQAKVIQLTTNQGSLISQNLIGGLHGEETLPISELEYVFDRTNLLLEIVAKGTPGLEELNHDILKLNERLILRKAKNFIASKLPSTIEEDDQTALALYEQSRKNRYLDNLRLNSLSVATLYLEKG